MKRRMQIDIWSDVRCPFCYIGKRKFETALKAFMHKDQVEVNWHSFELDPNLKTNTAINVYDYFIGHKGVTREQALKMHSQVSRTAHEAGLKFDFDQAVIANSFNAHRLIQLAKSKGLADQVEEELFKAHFSEGKNIDDPETLVQTGASAGLDPEKVREMLSSSQFEREVRQDEFQAQTIGIRGVPFFVFNNQYAVSGAQAPEIFLGTLEKSFSAFEKEAKDLIISEGDSCTEDGDCV